MSSARESAAQSKASGTVSGTFPLVLALRCGLAGIFSKRCKRIVWVATIASNLLLL